jgi:predicted N-formylglutamate amidohydrolase
MRGDPLRSRRAGRAPLDFASEDRAAAMTANAPRREDEPPLPKLLGPDDPQPVEIIDPRGAASVLLVCDHASRAVPRSLGRLGLDESALMQHIGWDIGAAEVTRHLGGRLDAPAVLSGFSRLVVDCNRRLEDPSAMPAVSDGTAVPGNRDLAPASRALRVAALYEPYHAAIERRLAAFAARGVAPAIVSVHSFTPVMNDVRRPWHIGILWDKDGRIAEKLIANLRARGDLVVGDNEPYSAREPAGYTLLRHAEPVGLPHALLEIRQDLIDTPAGAATWAEIIAAALRPILACPELYRAQVFR